MLQTGEGDALNNADLSIGMSNVSNWNKNRNEIEDFCTKMKLNVMSQSTHGIEHSFAGDGLLKYHIPNDNLIIC